MPGLSTRKERARTATEEVSKAKKNTVSSINSISEPVEVTESTTDWARLSSLEVSKARACCSSQSSSTPKRFTLRIT